MPINPNKPPLQKSLGPVLVMSISDLAAIRVVVVPPDPRTSIVPIHDPTPVITSRFRFLGRPGY